MNNEFDDDELRGELQDLAPDVDVGGALDALRPVARRARTRHRARLATFTAACVVVVGGTAVALTSAGNDRVAVTPATSPEIAEASTTTIGPDPTTTPTTVSATTPTGAPVTTPDSTPGSTPGSPPPSTPRSTPGSPPASTPGAAPTSTPATDDHGGGNDTAPDSGTQTFSDEVGSIDVRVSNGALVLVDARPAPGYDEAVDQREVRDDRIRVEFEREDGDHQGKPARIEVRLVNGEIHQTPSGRAS
jgi:hypothetical protein